MTYGKLIINGEFRDSGFTIEYNSLYLNDDSQKEAIFIYLKSLYNVLNSNLVPIIEFFEHFTDEIKSDFMLSDDRYKMVVDGKKLILNTL